MGWQRVPLVLVQLPRFPDPHLPCYTPIPMGKIESTLKEEISRLSRKELRATVDPLVKEVRQLRRRVSQLEKTVAVLEREAGKRRKSEQKALQNLSPLLPAVNRRMCDAILESKRLDRDA